MRTPASRSSRRTPARTTSSASTRCRSTRSTSRSSPTRSTPRSRWTPASARGASPGCRRSSPRATRANGSTSSSTTSPRRPPSLAEAGRWYHPPPPVSQTAPTYDLMLLLDPAAEDDARAKIVADAQAAIDAEGTLLGHQPWGLRPLAYEIGHRTQAEYHLLQFNGPPSLISSLEHTL